MPIFAYFDDCFFLTGHPRVNLSAFRAVRRLRSSCQRILRLYSIRIDGFDHHVVAEMMVYRRRVGIGVNDLDDALDLLARVEVVDDNLIVAFVGDRDLPVTIQGLQGTAARVDDLAVELDESALNLDVPDFDAVVPGVVVDNVADAHRRRSQVEQIVWAGRLPVGDP